MAATVTIDKKYFEALLRRAEFHTSDREVTTPVHLPTVTISKTDHDNLIRMAQEYTCLRDSLYKGGVRPETLEVLIRGGQAPPVPQDTYVGNQYSVQQRGTEDPSDHFPKADVLLSRPSDSLWGNTERDWPSTNNNDFQGYSKRKAPSNSRQNSYTQDDDILWDPDLDKDESCLGIPRVERKRYAREERRTIIVRNLPDRATHKDITGFVRGGLLLDVFLRSSDRSASISFVEGSAAQNFMNYVKRNDIYVHGKRLEFVWNDRHFNLPGHVANKIGIGATRNLIIRKVHPNITEERLRQDLDHIHNLTIIEIAFQGADAYLQLNSIHNSLFARTCMMSRAVYKGLRIEWLPDECAQPLPKTQHVQKKENIAPPVAKKANIMMNRFQMLNLNADGTEDDSEEEDEPALAPSMDVKHSSPWNTRTVAA